MPAVALDGTGRIIETNSAWRAVGAAGGAPAAAIGIDADYLHLCERWHVGDGVDIAAGIRTVLTGEELHFSCEYSTASPYGTTTWWSLRVTPLGQLGGGAIAAHLDITSLRAVEEELRSMDDRVRLHVDSSVEIFALVDHSGRVVDVSSRTLEILGVDRGEVMGRNAAGRVHPLDVEPLLAAVRGVADLAGSRAAVEVDVRDGVGRWRRLDLLIANLFDAPGVNAVVVTGTDATARHAAAIRSTLESHILDRLPAAVSVTNDRGAVVYWNSAASDLFGWSEHEVLGRPGRDIAAGLPAAEHLPGALEHTDHPGRWEGDWDAATPSGDTVPVYATLHRLSLDAIGFSGIVMAAVDVSERRRLEQELAYIALHDPLTGLPNRSLLVDRLTAALGRVPSDRHVAVLDLDLDRFGEVNELAGRAGGDEVLRAVAELLRAGSPDDATTVARIEGDEFVVVLEGVESADAAVRAAHRLQTALSAPTRIASDTRHLRASVGIAMGTGSDKADGLLRDAAAAMYRAKSRARGRIELFDPVLQAQARAHDALAIALRRAIEHEELVVHYQPLWSVASGMPVGAEALVRWQRPGHGLLPPGAFVPFAEASGEIAAVDAYVLDVACRDLRAWSVEGAITRVSVNVSARQLGEAAFPMLVERTLVATRVDPARVCLEITESAVMEDVDRSIATLRALKALGLRLAIDDFGTGYSSLAYLKRLPVDELKVDRSFVDGLGRDPEDTVIVSAVVSLARTLGLEVVAEGVETERQLEELRALGCTTAQGFLWSGAVDREAFAAVLADARLHPPSR
ncbi:MAG TPA: EAL domain-containing protein [Acidimicrobiales bacterium]|nr:EAL domain-containing protein [Acidimicrobiales bacterium]